MADAGAVARIMADVRPRVLVHFAAESHVDRSIVAADAFVRTNVLGTQVLLDAARRHRVERFLYVSTDEVYGSLGPEGRFTESSPLAPNSPYAASKAAGGLLVRAAVHTHSLHAVITRGSNTYGPRQFPEKLIPVAIAHALQDRPVPLYGDGRQVRNWIHVEDHCRGILAAVERGQPGAVYNLGGDTEMENGRLVALILDLLGKPHSLVASVTDRLGHDRRYALDASLAHRELDWRPRVPFEHGLAATVAWYQSQPDWLSGALAAATATRP